jgi:hypothetical protein
MQRRDLVFDVDMQHHSGVLPVRAAASLPVSPAAASSGRCHHHRDNSGRLLSPGSLARPPTQPPPAQPPCPGPTGGRADWWWYEPFQPQPPPVTTGTISTLNQVGASGNSCAMPGCMPRRGNHGRRPATDVLRKPRAEQAWRVDCSRLARVVNPPTVGICRCALI